MVHAIHMEAFCRETCTCFDILKAFCLEISSDLLILKPFNTPSNMTCDQSPGNTRQCSSLTLAGVHNTQYSFSIHFRHLSKLNYKQKLFFYFYKLMYCAQTLKLSNTE